MSISLQHSTTNISWKELLSEYRGPLAAAAVAGLIGLSAIFIGDIPAGEDAFESVIVLLFLFAAAVAVFFWGFKEYRKKSLVENVPTSKVQSLAQGLVELEGKAVPQEGQGLRSPLTGERCILYRYVVEEYRDRGDDGYWKTLDEGMSDTVFYLDDGTGQVPIDPEGCELRTGEDNVFTVDEFKELPGPAKEFIRDSDRLETQEDEFFPEERRFTEYYITPGEHIYVFGKAFPREGHAGSTVNQENAIINYDRDTPMFLISDKTEDELKESMTDRILLAIIGGFLVSIGSFAGLLYLLSLI